MEGKGGDLSRTLYSEKMEGPEGVYVVELFLVGY